MAILKYSAAVLFTFLATALTTPSLRAATVTITVAGTSGVINGTNDYVLPYFLTLSGDGLTSPVTVAADCYDFFDEVKVGQSWSANVLTLPQIASVGQYSGLPNALTLYEEVAWFSAQTYTNTDQEIALQQDMWNVFLPEGGVPAFAVTPDMQTYLTALAATNLSTYNYAPFIFLEGVSNDSSPQGSPLVQAFILDNTGGIPLKITATPEPGSLFLMLTGLGLAAAYWMASRRKRSVNSASL